MQNNFKYPSFRIHQSVTWFCLPLSKFSRLPSNASKRLVIGALIAHPSDPSRVLLVKRAAGETLFPGQWEIPGGKAEYGVDQTLLETVVREVKEETGLRVTAVKGEFEAFEYKGSKGLCKQYNFVVEGDGEVVLNPEEHEEWKWVEEGDLEGLEMTDVMRNCVRNGLAKV
ncbi:hypothetical protein IAT38_002260 [Cryptococcus sp. DSM 104549]